MMLFRFILSLLQVLLFTQGVCGTAIAKREVVDLPISSPNASTVWTVGSIQTVTWTIPANLSNATGDMTGFIILQSVGGIFNQTPTNLITGLAENFFFLDLHVDVLVPDVPTRDDYFITMFGDALNRSPHFTILNGSQPASEPNTTLSWPSGYSMLVTSDAPTAASFSLFTSSTPLHTAAPPSSTTTTTAAPASSVSLATSPVSTASGLSASSIATSTASAVSVSPPAATSRGSSLALMVPSMIWMFGLMFTMMCLLGI